MSRESAAHRKLSSGRAVPQARVGWEGWLTGTWWGTCSLSGLQASVARGALRDRNLYHRIQAACLWSIFSENHSNL